jgi:hypothetical protein
MSGRGRTGLPGGLMRKLRRESRGDPAMLAQLAAEATARRWLVSLGVPAWRNPAPPSEGGRYSLILACGKRIAVSPAGARIWSFDSMAAARCSVLLVMDPGPDGSDRTPAGWLRLRDVLASGDPEEAADLVHLALRPAGSLASQLPRSRRSRLAFLLGSLRLLLLGEPAAPPPEADQELPTSDPCPEHDRAAESPIRETDPCKDRNPRPRIASAFLDRGSGA